MRRAERIVHVEIRQRSQLLGELLVVRLLLGMKPQILQKQGLPLLQLHGDFLRLGSHAVRREAHVLAPRQFLVEYHAQPFGYRLQAHLGIGFALRPPQMRGQDQPCPMPQRVLDRGQGLADAGVVHNPAVFQRNIEVDPHKDAVATKRQIADGKLGHLAGRPY
jgi:hypothetical protein